MSAPGSSRLRLWVRWSWRDLRRRWLLVAAIAVIIAIGTGTFAGLGSTATWRRLSNDASYAALRMHDLRVELSEGSYVEEGALAEVVASFAARDEVVAVEERLFVPTQVDASDADETVLVPGELIGISLDRPLTVDALHVASGRAPAAGETAAVLEQKFAEHYDLPPSGTISVGGGNELAYTGYGVTPELFLVTDQSAGVFGQSNFAAVFVPLAEAQRLGGHEGRVNDLVLRIRAGADRDAVQAALAAALTRDLPDIGATVATRDDDQAYRVLYDDIENDQQLWNLFALVILLAASFAAFNLISRIVDAERREIGVGMALGAPPRRLAIRPMLVGVQVALVGVVLGVVIGLLVGAAMRSLLVEFLPLPEWRTPFQLGVYAQSAALGLALPLIATAIPVWRAVRVEPIEAIRTGPHSARAQRSGFAPFFARLPLGRRTLVRMPFRETVRAPRRTLLTVLGIAGAIASFVVVLGMLDSWLGALNDGDAELSRTAADRLDVQLEGFVPSGAPVITAIGGSDAVARAEPGLRLPATVRPPGVEVGDEDREIDVIAEVLDLDAAMWTPSLVERAPGRVDDGIVLSSEAAADLGVGVGDTVVLRHPRREGVTSYTFVDSALRVSALHPHPLRVYAYLDVSQVDRFALAGISNVVRVLPGPGSTSDEVQRALFGLDGVAWVQPISLTTEVIEDLLDDFIGILRLLQGIVLALALLIAFNSASISVDERAREQATMFAFGVRVRTVLAILLTESVIMGLLGTAVGIGLGFLTLRWVTGTLLSETMPEFGVDAVLTPETLLVTLALGVLAVAVAPLFTLRRLRRMDVPATLRVLE